MEYYNQFKKEPELIDKLFNYITEEKKLIFTREEIANIYFSLKTQNLLILNSKPGMGKTELSQSFIDGFRSIFSDEGVESVFVSVEKDFDTSELLGYVGLDGEYRPTEFIQKIFLNPKEEIDDSAKFYFVTLDEMNLSLIDFYFSKILSCIENNKPLTLPNNEEVFLPKNCFFIGTINSYIIESSRTPLSNSVKRRANIINVRNPLDKILEITDSVEQSRAFKNVIMKLIDQSKMNFEKKADVLSRFRTMNFIGISDERLNEIIELLFELTKSLSSSEENKLTLGVLQDICEYIIFSSSTVEESLDIQIEQKILVSITGNIANLNSFGKFLEKYNLTNSLELFGVIERNAKLNMGYVLPMC